MSAFLDTIADHVREEVHKKRRNHPPSEFQDRALFHQPRRDFAGSFQSPSRHIIAEVKRASPSKGVIREEFDPVAIARSLAASGASALSILTEERFFQGSLSYLEKVRDEVGLPLLRKDFVVDRYQLVEARGFGADAVLLILALLDVSLLRELMGEARSLALQALVEVHTQAELECALAAEAALIGINSRDLKTFQVNRDVLEQLVPMVPKDRTVVCESGIESPGQMTRLEALGAHVFLVGETLMRACDPGEKLRELLGCK